MDQRQAQLAVIRLFHTVFTIVENCDAKRAVSIHHVCPLMHAMLEVGEGIGISERFRTKTDIKGRNGIGNGQREERREQRASLSPVHLVLHVHAIHARNQAYGLHERAHAVLVRDLERHGGSALLGDFNRDLA